MNVKIFDTPEVQEFLNTVSGFDQAGGNDRAKQIMRRLLSDLYRLIDDFDAYEMPERLPNGDIIIRRKPPAPALPDPEHGIEI